MISEFLTCGIIPLFIVAMGPLCPYCRKQLRNLNYQDRLQNTLGPVFRVPKSLPNGTQLISIHSCPWVRGALNNKCAPHSLICQYTIQCNFCYQQSLNGNEASVQWAILLTSIHQLYLFGSFDSWTDTVILQMKHMDYLECHPGQTIPACKLQLWF